MATNKHAIIRYEALNRCFSNRGRKFFIEDLIKYVSDALTDYIGKEASISRRQLSIHEDAQSIVFASFQNSIKDFEEATEGLKFTKIESNGRFVQKLVPQISSLI